ncbi:dihydrodipicolinate synthase family protein [Bifidobacterium leontopitheci]|uniref:Dihydrodipicolinate synthase n=1 Tax=Bifidobacterium leontopitheci TaxID=2650774 RepID=A0A6I1GP45_9BIFI|nr:dihydrodipicolinate synthase family protein [Bifidobacterium leontopitheci]KAB7791067.1 dihydrodipicolinate synthase [Bifidobacterium leontopitheci]
MGAQFEGVFCPSITITKADGSLDEELWGRHLDHLIEAGINGVLLFGSIGEFYAYPLEFKERAVDFAVRHVNGRIPVLVGVGGTNFGDVLAFSKHAENVGANGLVVVSPYYFGPSEAAAERYFGTIADSVELPVLLYNFPPRTGADLSPQLVASLAAKHPNIVGIKDTVDTISHTRMVIDAVRKVNPDFSVLSGFDEYYTPNRIAGGNGVLCGLTNVVPEDFAAMHRAWQKGDYATALDHAKRISKLMAVYGQADLFIGAIKEAVRVKGLPIDTTIREPQVPLTDGQKAAIADLLA